MAEVGHRRCDLGYTAPLDMPWITINGQLQPAFSAQAAQLSFELASSAYSMDADPWRASGWYDVSYLGSELLTGEAANGGSGNLFKEIVSDYLQYRARQKLKKKSAITQAFSALVLPSEGEACKAMIMMHRLAGGRYVVAIGFMGTGKQLTEWLPNLRVAHEEGAHQGFLKLTREFEAAASQVVFLDTAKELGMPSLTLRDILTECHSPASRFRIWMAGHSKGAAVMQLFAMRQMMQGGLRQHFIGYGFASPSVLYDFVPQSYPIYNIMNMDDVVPRVGASMHVGHCRLAASDSSMKEIVYAGKDEDQLFKRLQCILRGIGNTAEGLVFISALLIVLQRLSDAESVMMISASLEKNLPEKWTDALGNRIDYFLDWLLKRVNQGYEDALAVPIPAQAVHLRVLQLDELVSHYGASVFLKTLLKNFELSHKLRYLQDKGSISAYEYMVYSCFDRLKQEICGGVAPVGYWERNTKKRRYPVGKYTMYSAKRVHCGAKRRKL